MNADTGLEDNRPAPELDELEGVVDRIVYESDETGFFVGKLKQGRNGSLVTFVGDLMAVSVGETIRLWGRWVDDKRFGRQFRVERYQTVLPATPDAIEKYLGSGLIHGIGPAYAKRLVEAFGVETLRIIDEEPGRLRSVAGIGAVRARQIREAWEAQKSVQSIMLFLQGHGISMNQASRIYRQYGSSAVAVLRENPYRLAEDIAGIAFRSADAIAMGMGIAKDAPKRIEAGLEYALRKATAEGHCFLPKEELVSRASGLLGISEGVTASPLASLAAAERVVQERGAVYLAPMYFEETACDRFVKRLVSAPKGGVSIKVDKAIEWVERQQGIRLSPEQQTAICTAVDAKVMVMTGGPGTGKTTLIKGLVDIFEKKGLRVELAAPTGRAAKRMEAATAREARTIHRLLEFSPKQGAFTRDETNPLNADLIIIDESSMVDLHLLYSLLKAVPQHARLFFVGDVDQLPSVGPGNVLLDIIASGVVPVVWLKTVFRQAAQSGIVANAHRINAGEYPKFNADDFFFVERKDPAKARDTILELVTDRMPKSFGLDSMRDIQVLAPMHRGEAGVASLNEVLQNALNPKGEPLPRKGFRVGDKVMQLRNNYELDVYNGDVGLIALADADAREVEVRFEDRRVLYPFEQLDDLALAYAATVHKAQGSEYPAVVVPLLGQHYMMLQRNVLYTAITRAGRVVVLVGEHRAVSMAVRNTQVAQRNTRLADRLRNTL